MSNISLNLILSRTTVLRFLFVRRDLLRTSHHDSSPVHATECKVAQNPGIQMSS